MPKILSLDDQMEGIYAQSLTAQRSSNRKDIERMKKVVLSVMAQNLTERQSMCLRMYYFDNLNMTKIGHTLGLNPSTVSRHIHAAISKLQRLEAFF